MSSLSQGARENSLPLKLFNYISPSCSIAEPDFILHDTDKHTLDNYQMNAIKACLGSEVCFVHGPPGTGKTITLVNLVNECTNNGERILVSCHTNIACDNVLDQFIKYSHEKMVENMLDRGEIIRIGTPVLQNSKVKELTIEAIYERLDKGLQIEKESLSHLINSLTQKNQEYLEFKQIFLELEMLRERIDHCEENITKSKGIIHKCVEAESKLNQAISEKRELLAIAGNRNAIINLVRKTRPKDIKQLIILLSIQKMEEHKVRRKEEQRLELLSGEFDKISSSFTEKSGGLPAGIGLEQINDELEQTNSDLGITKKKANDLNKKISELNERIIDEAKVVVATLTKTFTDPILINMQFDRVVVDEASIAPLPMLFYVSTMAKDKVSIFGDPKQLAPIGLSDKSHAKRWLRRDIFQEADATEFKENDPRIQSLNNQYRMHRDIFRIVNNYFYGNLFNRKTENGQDDVYGRLFPKSKQRVAIVDTSDANACISTERMGPKSNSRYNVYHIQIIERILHDLFDGQQIEEKDVGIITPYRSQASFIRAMLVELGLKNIDVGTVHSFQGLERQYMIFDLVEAPGGKRISGLINDKHELYLGKSSSENEALRLNTVAFSRAREKLIIVSHNKYMLNNLPGDSVIRKIVVDLIDSGAVISGSNLVPYYVPEEDYPDVALIKQEELFDKEAVFNQKSFYKHLIQDLESAEKEVIFISGYMTSNRMGKLMPHLVKLLSRGVNVKVFTKPPREQLSRLKELEQLHNTLRGMGIEIYQHYGTHEKVVSIDGRVMYVGSLNTLSFNHSSSEMMIRSNSKTKIQKVFSILAKNYPRLEDYLTGIGYVIREEPVDLTPEKFQDIMVSLRPKKKELPQNKLEAKEYYSSMFTKLRWVIADDKRIPNFAILFVKTVREMLNNPPTSVRELMTLPEFTRNRSNIRGYEEIVLEILKEYEGVITKVT